MTIIKNLDNLVEFLNKSANRGIISFRSISLPEVEFTPDMAIDFIKTPTYRNISRDIAELYNDFMMYYFERLPSDKYEEIIKTFINAPISANETVIKHMVAHNRSDNEKRSLYIKLLDLHYNNYENDLESFETAQITPENKKDITNILYSISANSPKKYIYNLRNLYAQIAKEENSRKTVENTFCSYIKDDSNSNVFKETEIFKIYGKTFGYSNSNQYLSFRPELLQKKEITKPDVEYFYYGLCIGVKEERTNCPSYKMAFEKFDTERRNIETANRLKNQMTVQAGELMLYAQHNQDKLNIARDLQHIAAQTKLNFFVSAKDILTSENKITLALMILNDYEYALNQSEDIMEVYKTLNPVFEILNNVKNIPTESASQLADLLRPYSINAKKIEQEKSDTLEQSQKELEKSNATKKLLEDCNQQMEKIASASSTAQTMVNFTNKYLSNLTPELRKKCEDYIISILQGKEPKAVSVKKPLFNFGDAKKEYESNRRCVIEYTDGGRYVKNNIEILANVFKTQECLNFNNIINILDQQHNDISNRVKKIKNSDYTHSSIWLLKIERAKSQHKNAIENFGNLQQLFEKVSNASSVPNIEQQRNAVIQSTGLDNKTI